MSRIIINDWLAWGNLLKTWTTGTSYFETGKMYARPRTLDELKTQLIESGAGSVPDWVVDFELIEWSENKLVIELPSSRTIMNAEALLRTGKAYPLPAFYQNAARELGDLDDVTARLAFHTMRMGEHVVDAFG